MALPLAVGLTLVIPISAGLASQGLRIPKTLRETPLDKPNISFPTAANSPKPEEYTENQQDRL